jgi:hypothetical protein
VNSGITGELVNKLNNIEDGAQKNPDLSDYAKKTDIPAPPDLSEYSKTVDVDEKLEKKQGKLEAGDNVTIKDGVISVMIPEQPIPPDFDLSNYVTKDGDETITGEKTFTGGFRVTNSEMRDEGDSGYLDVIFSEYEGCNITTCSPFVVKSYDGDSWGEVLGGYDCGSSIVMTPWDFEIASNLYYFYASEDGSIDMSSSSSAGIYLHTHDGSLTIYPDRVDLMNTYYFFYDCVTTTGDFNLCSDVIPFYNQEYGETNFRPTGARLFLNYDTTSASLIASDYEWTDEYETEYTESGYAFDVNYDGEFTFRNIADDESAVTFTLDEFRILKQMIHQNEHL